MALVQRAGSFWNARRTCELSSRGLASYVSYNCKATPPRARECSACIHTEPANANTNANVKAPAGGGGGGSKHLISAKQIELTFAELELKPVQEQVGGCRIRQHVNPLKASLMAPVKTPNWDEVFTDCSRPLTVDIGCGSGRFVMVLAKRNSAENFLGIDVRERLVDRAKQWAEELDLTNIHFVTTNATVHLDTLLASYPGPLAYVTILCPDPHFKQRHHKRRVVQKQLVDTIIRHLAPKGKLFIQSDVKEVAIDMRKQFDEHLGLTLVRSSSAPCDSEGWVVDNPLGLPSEREVHVLTQGGRIYRTLYERA
ncbi:tRNA (guanine-N7-)-methyltransferase [Marchantia polymorpha subsp. ruderalis]|uniref:tRNA (guanine(46)-N(7))-methyltransferase n=2 Tax=Marchantia polymorpha TaxID=3197 RepID=A0AAF6AYK7_MARPO|nr:hypothetical protein MARPO_0006s0284 [Marchantia polymorpha]BBN04841.1 hypothetical protein Mp_3g08090 [Marchantia polymorpha subsp. ruderalis]|eukprot:PTQ48293.1 hypothetical protein MARPO_0006s0284 [Marchantia polymorpha]